MYFLLGFNTWGSQMKEMAPRENFGFHQVAYEVVCASAVKFLRDRVSLTEEVKMQKRVSEK
jgi:hypothetical protein